MLILEVYQLARCLQPRKRSSKKEQRSNHSKSSTRANINETSCYDTSATNPPSTLDVAGLDACQTSNRISRRRSLRTTKELPSFVHSFKNTPSRRYNNICSSFVTSKLTFSHLSFPSLPFYRSLVASSPLFLTPPALPSLFSPPSLPQHELIIFRASADSAELAVRNLLKRVAQNQGTNKLHAIDHLDDGTPIELSITINENEGSAIFDFAGTGPEIYGFVQIPTLSKTAN